MFSHGERKMHCQRSYQAMHACTHKYTHALRGYESCHFYTIFPFRHDNHWFPCVKVTACVYVCVNTDTNYTVDIHSHVGKCYTDHCTRMHVYKLP